jgi:hypothetical protein
MVYEWFDRLAADYDNLRAAIEWGQAERPEEALLLIGNLAFFWLYRADDRQQALYWLNDLLAQVDEQLADSLLSERQLRARSRSRIAAGLLMLGQGDTPAATDSVQAAIAIERKLGPGFWLAFALGLLADLAIMVGDVDNARQAAEEALSLREELDSRWLLLSLPILMAIEYRRGNQARVDQLRQEFTITQPGRPSDVHSHLPRAWYGGAF